MGFSTVVLMGNLTADPDVKVLPSGSKVTEFAVAINRKFGDKEQVAFVNCVAWNGRGEMIAQYFRKGNPILLQGEIQEDRWEDQEGNRRSRLKVFVTNVTFVGGGKNSSDNGDDHAENQSESKPAPKASKATTSPAKKGGRPKKVSAPVLDDDDDDDIPF